MFNRLSEEAQTLKSLRPNLYKSGQANRSFFLCSALFRLLKTKFQIRKYRLQNATVPKVFKEWVKKQPDKPIIYFNDQVWTFRELDQFSNRVANAFIELGFNPGDEVALFMESKPEYIGIWLGLAKAGIVTALINTNQRNESLIHSILSINSKALIFGSELQEHVQEAYSLLRERRELRYFCFQNSSKTNIPCYDLQTLIQEASSEDPSTLYLGNYTGNQELVLPRLIAPSNLQTKSCTFTLLELLGFPRRR